MAAVIDWNPPAPRSRVTNHMVLRRSAAPSAAPATSSEGGRIASRSGAPIAQRSGEWKGAVPSAVHGRGGLAVVRGFGGRSVVTRAYATSPLRLLLPKNHGSAAWVYTSSYGGGLVDGDRIALDVEVGPGAAGFLSTQASTKVYRSAQGTSTELHARVSTDGLLAVIPDPTVCFAASRYSQTQTFDLSGDSGLVLVDWVSSGRHASGERWAFHEYVARLRAHVDGRLVLHDALALRSGDGDLRDRLGRFDVLAVLLILGTRLSGQAAEVVARVAEIPVRRRPDELVAASPVEDCGCLLRVAGTSVEQTARMIREYLGFLPGLLGDDPWARKW
jgi:urease accessory protein